MMPSTNLITAGTVGASATGAVASLFSGIPGSVLYSIGSGLLGLLTLIIKAHYDGRSSAIAAENQYLKARIKDLEGDLERYRPTKPAA